MKDLDDGFMLLVHPYPQIEGEMLLVQLNSEDYPDPEAENQKLEEEKQEEEKEKKEK